ncbi:MAG: hypothetical protein J7M18_05940 [Candidatus Eremiobacteraeota bacterium]|nr:hypothetical protein [Candidatus Eremiobacteraeota bacterium]
MEIERSKKPVDSGMKSGSEKKGRDSLPPEIYGLVTVIVNFLSQINRARVGKDWSKEVKASPDP